MEVDPASPADRDRGARRPRRYIQPGESRMSERFRTQPITSAERLESDRYRKGFPWKSGGALESHFIDNILQWMAEHDGYNIRHSDHDSIL